MAAYPPFENERVARTETPVSLSIDSGVFCSTMLGLFGILLTIIPLMFIPNSLQAITVSRVWLSVPSMGVETLTAGRPVFFYPQATASAPPRLAANEAVPVALVLNELILNAAKHGAAAEPIKVAMAGDPKSAHISVTNPGALPRQFDYTAGTGLGTGLELVRALVPSAGAALSFSGDNGRVTAVLDLGEPLLAASADTMERTRDEWDRRKRSYSDRRR